MHKIRKALPSDLAAVEEIAQKAYSIYIKRIGKPPTPMLEDYTQLIGEGVVNVLEVEGVVVGFLVLIPRGSYMLLENIAIHPKSQSQGYGSMLMKFAEDTAKEMGFNEIQLYTHEKMVENYDIYTHLGWSEFKRQDDDGYRRIYMKKRL